MEKGIIEKLQKLKGRINDDEIINLYEETVLKLNDQYISYWFAKNIVGANVKAHGDVVIESKSPILIIVLH